jgi:uncharacterized repeat protein (TIGR03803 family)
MDALLHWKVASCCALASLLTACGDGGTGTLGPLGPELTSPQIDGVGPSGLTQGRDGNFYGTTSAGGQFAMGTVFRLTPGGEETVVYSFKGGTVDGKSPGGLIQGSDGNFYGTTSSGGVNECQQVEPVGYSGGPTGCGTAFRVSADGVETVLYFFRGAADGGNPNAGLVEDGEGNFYGTAQYGGTACVSCGVVFRIAAGTGESAVYSFTGKAGDGSLPTSLMLAADGNLYGTTEVGGQGDFGTIFRVTPAGTETVLYSFGGGEDGELPLAPLVEGSDGNFYGTEPFGGNRRGTIFSITPAGVKTVLHAFAGGAADGADPYTPLVQGNDGNFYGTTSGGGDSTCADGCGTAFKVTSSGEESPIYEFPAYVVGQVTSPPSPANLLQGSDGNLYGTTGDDGQFGGGSVFRMNPTTGVKTVLHAFGGGANQ